MRPLRLIVLPLLVATIAACESNKIDNSMIIDPGTGVSYAAEVQPLFTSGCGGFGCHIGEATNGVNLTTYADVMASVGLQYGGPIVVAGNGAGSPLVDKIGPNPTHGSRMPLTSEPFSATQINIIRTWIDEGAENN